MKNAVSAYSRFMDLLVARLRSENILVYLDDIIITTTEEEQHLRDLRRVLDMHRHAGIKLNAKKTHLFKSEVDYLGFRVNYDGIGMKDSYVERIVNWPTPTSGKQLSSLLGFLK